MRITRDKYAKEHGAYLFFGIVEDVEVKERDEEVEELMRSVEEAFREKYTLEKLREDPKVKAFRKFMWSLGIDPTKIRPSSEALARRALRGPLPRINSLTDLGNAISLKYLVPIGIYDLDHVKGDELALRKAKEGEIFQPIGRNDMTLKGNEIVLSDEEGPMHIFPYRDSRRTMIRLGTRRALVVGAGVTGVDEIDVRAAVEEILNFLEKRGARVGSVAKSQ